MNKKMFFTSTAALLASLAIAIPGNASNKTPTVGIVDFSKCIIESKYGKKEQENYESLKTRMQKAVEELDGQMTETANKLQDKDLLDSLSPEAEQELREKFQSLQGDMQRYQGQFYQVMQQANMKLMQAMHVRIEEASNAVAKINNLSLLLNKDAAFYYDAQAHDMTDKIIKELDQHFDKDQSMTVSKTEDKTQQ